MGEVEKTFRDENVRRFETFIFDWAYETLYELFACARQASESNPSKFVSYFRAGLRTFPEWETFTCNEESQLAQFKLPVVNPLYDYTILAYVRALYPNDYKDKKLGQLEIGAPSLAKFCQSFLIRLSKSNDVQSLKFFVASDIDKHKLLKLHFRNTLQQATSNILPNIIKISRGASTVVTKKENTARPTHYSPMKTKSIAKSSFKAPSPKSIGKREPSPYRHREHHRHSSHRHRRTSPSLSRDRHVHRSRHYDNRHHRHHHHHSRRRRTPIPSSSSDSSSWSGSDRSRSPSYSSYSSSSGSEVEERRTPHRREKKVTPVQSDSEDSSQENSLPPSDDEGEVQVKIEGEEEEDVPIPKTVFHEVTTTQTPLRGQKPDSTFNPPITKRPNPTPKIEEVPATPSQREPKSASHTMQAPKSISRGHEPPPSVRGPSDSDFNQFCGAIMGRMFQPNKDKEGSTPSLHVPPRVLGSLPGGAPIPSTPMFPAQKQSVEEALNSSLANLSLKEDKS